MGFVDNSTATSEWSQMGDRKELNCYFGQRKS